MRHPDLHQLSILIRGLPTTSEISSLLSALANSSFAFNIDTIFKTSAMVITSCVLGTEFGCGKTISQLTILLSFPIASAIGFKICLQYKSNQLWRMFLMK